MSSCWSCSGRLFHNVGPAVAKQRSPNWLRDLLTRHVWLSADRRGRNEYCGWGVNDRYGSWVGSRLNCVIPLLHTGHCQSLSGVECYRPVLRPPVDTMCICHMSSQCVNISQLKWFTVKPVFFAYPLFREFRETGKFAKITGRDNLNTVAFQCSRKQKRQNYGVQNNYIDSNAKIKGGQN